MTECCRTCKFYQPLNVLNEECRRYPRMPVFHGVSYRTSYYYPKMTGSDWCGEWKPSKELQILLDKYSKEES